MTGPYIHPSMTDSELIAAVRQVEARPVRLLSTRLQDRIILAAMARDNLQGIDALIESGQLVDALLRIDAARQLLDFTHAPGYEPAAPLTR